MTNRHFKSSLINILAELGFKHEHDKTTIIPLDAFEKLSEDLVIKMVDEYQLGLHGLYVPLDGERKMELINRVLELRHSMIIDEVKELDDKDQEGYELEDLTI